MGVVLALVACGPAPDAQTGQYRATNGTEPARHVIHPSPDVTNAQWWPGKEGDALVFGNSAADPMLTLICNPATGVLDFFRHVDAPEGARALAAFDAKMPIARWPVEAFPLGQGRVWKGEISLADEGLVVFAATRPLEVTIPAAGTLRLPTSGAPASMIALCKQNTQNLASGSLPQPSGLPAPPAPPAFPE